jgi:hypothetical protein
VANQDSKDRAGLISDGNIPVTAVCSSRRTAWVSMVRISTQQLVQLGSFSDGSIIRHLLLYPVSVCITIVSIVLESPADAQARSRAQHVSDFVDFLRGMQRDRILDVQGLLDLCCEFDRLVLEAIANVASGTTSSDSLLGGITPGHDSCSEVRW